MNLTSLLADLYRRLAYPAAPAASEVTRLTSFLNTTHRQILTVPGMDKLRDHTITFASVANQVLYGLPPSVARIEAITDRTNQWKLDPVALEDVLQADPGLTSTGSSDRYINRGWQQVAVQPAAATGLWAVSSSASDTTQSIKVETVRTGGLSSSAAVTLNGTTRVQVAALTDHIEVTKFYSSLVGVGDISLYTAAAAGTLLATIPIGLTYARYLAIQLYPTPASAITYSVDYVRNVLDMSNGTDEPLLPEDFHYLLVEGALLKEWTKRDDDRRVQADQDYHRGLSALKYFMHAQADDLPLAGVRRYGRSRFGAYFPVTRY
jgi:hypothetical protein